MSTWLSLLAGAVLGAFASLVVAVYLQDRWKASSDRRRRLRRTRAISQSWSESDGPITIAGIPTSVYLIEGDGFLVIEPQNARVDIRSTRAELPVLVMTAREKVARQLTASSRSKNQTVSSWNSPNMIALTGYHISRTAQREDAMVHLEACLNDYATFAATVLRLDEEINKSDTQGEHVPTTLRREFLSTPAAVAESVRRPLPFLANGVGIMLLAFTDDDKVLLVHRRLESRARPGECDVTVVEGIDANFDSGGAGRLDIYATAVRGCREELGVDVSAADVSILAFGVDMTYYQWNFLGLVDIRLAADEVIARHGMHAKDRWEGKLEPVKVDPVNVFERLRQDKIWDCGLVTTYLALCKKCGVHTTREAADKVFGFRDRKRPWQR
jgi:hypothetical protein